MADIYAAPNWVVNRNGNTHNDIRDRYVEMHRAAMDLHAAMQRVVADPLNGRNYQTVNRPHQTRDLDIERMTQMMLQVDGIATHAVAGVARVIRQREDL